MPASDHGIEQPVAADEPADALPASPPRREPAHDDPGSGFTRKRPRLDDGSDALRAMSADPASPASPASPAAGAASAAETQVEMTIRPLPPSSPVPGDTDERPNAEKTLEEDAAPIISPILVPTSDDEAASPPVMIIDDEEEESIASFRVQLDAHDYFDQFPFQNHASQTNILKELSHHVQHSHILDPTVLPRLTSWLSGIPHPETNAQDFYLDRALFWDEFGALVSRVLSRRHADLLQSIDLLADQDRNAFADQYDDDAQVEENFYRFLQAYVRIVAFLLVADVHLLSRPQLDGSHVSHLMSQKHLRILLTIMRPEKSAAFHVMFKDHGTDRDELGRRLHKDFLRAGGVQNIFQMADSVFHQVTPSLQNLIATSVSQILLSLGATIFEAPVANAFIERTKFCRGVLSFFRKYSEELHDPSTVTDANVARDLIYHYATLLHDLCLWDKTIATQLFDEFLRFKDPESPTSSSIEEATRSNVASYRQDTTALPILVSSAWKFKILRRYLIKGKMELRVMSIATMDNTLVEMWRELNSTEHGGKHPALQYLADFLLHGKVVDYIISVDSHPQLISRSGNIAGFLVVTNRWTDDQADAIWNTLTTSPDPRVVTATLTMLRTIIGLMNISDTLYFCAKIRALPVEKYTLDLIRFLRETTEKLMDKGSPSDFAVTGKDATPWNVCIHILRSTAPSRSVDKGLSEIHQEACEQLRLLASSIPYNEKHGIFRDCLQQIAERTAHATGSVQVVFVLTSASFMGDERFFQQNQSMTQQLVEELPAFVKSEKNLATFPGQIKALQYRLELLTLMICRATSAIPRNMYEEIWSHTIGPHALSNDARDLAWSQYTHATKLHPENNFCSQLASSYLATLAPEYYTLGYFDFVASYKFPTSRSTVSVDGSEATLVRIPGADLLWSMVLSAPKDTIEDRAARLLATRYVDVKHTEGVTIPDMEAAHAALVHKCMQELRVAFASIQSHSPQQSATEQIASKTVKSNAESSKLRCGRVLLFQKLMLESIRKKPEFNRPRRADSKVDSMDLDIPCGDDVAIRYQCGNDRQTVTMAAHHTVRDLYKRLCHTTGYSKLNLFANGHRLNVDQRGEEKVSEIKFGGQLLVQRAEGAESTRPSPGASNGSSTYETTFAQHFDELFAWMDSDDKTSQQLFEFLSLLPLRSDFADNVMEADTMSKTLFPAAKPFQARYVAQALQSKLREQIRQSTLDEEFLAIVVNRLEQALLDTNVTGKDTGVTHSSELTGVLVSTLLEFLRERPSLEISARYFNEGTQLLAQLFQITSIALQHKESAGLVQDAYAAILEACLHSRIVWNAFVAHPESRELHGLLLLQNPAHLIREHTATKIASICGGDLPSTCPLIKAEIAKHFWSLVAAILPEIVQFPSQSQQLFGIAEHVFRTNDEYDRNESQLRSCLVQWSTLLLQHKHVVFPGRDETDHVVFGFTKLLQNCLLSLKSFKKPLNTGTLMTRIFGKYLFTGSYSLAEPADETGPLGKPTIPVLDSQTRGELYDLVIALVDDVATYSNLLQLTADVETEDVEPRLSTIVVDRSIEIRSDTGYVGLFNPRAICYLNSLLTQLFMARNFRQFMLGLDVKEPDGTQRLLFQTQKLFAEMQGSFRKAVDPRGFAACVKNLENAPIDISIQMDSDEFFNLLFDQWEAQLLTPDQKQRFRSFYGGQALNQIKSKECEHVSERSEPFFALQCDVQGKANLEESLRSFIQGDVMEGDNKYKCESCDNKFVDAVKRTCIKEAPDNLIFHLKRFEFDLNDFSRKKIYDHFAFPESIDISLYQVDYLSDTTKPRKEDWFDLVGVLVHTGTCENGHYYSYIRERPSSSSDGPPTWVECNDSDVSPFDPADIPQKTFGGVTDDMYRQIKQYSAYMLFYQRRTAMEEDQEKSKASVSLDLATPVAEALQQEIDANNEMFLREYTLFDPVHSRFVRQLLAMSRTVNRGNCTEDHRQETSALQIVLAHLSRIVWRQQTPDMFLDTILQLRRSALTCSACCNIILKWLATDESGISNLLLRCSHAKVRSQTRAFLLENLRYLREKEPTLYGTESSESDSDTEAGGISDGTLSLIVQRLYDVAESSSISVRGWEDLYLCLTSIVDLGQTETAVLLNHGFLDFCLRLFCMHAHDPFRLAAPDLARTIEKRRGIFNGLIGFTYTLLSRTDLRLPVVPDLYFEARQFTFDRERSRFPLTKRERSILFLWSEDLKVIAVLDKILELFDQSKIEPFYPGAIVKWMLESPDVQAQQNLLKTMVEGISLDPTLCDAYIAAAVSFCEVCSVPDNVFRVIGAVAKAANSIERVDEERAPSGEAVVQFLGRLLTAENDILFEHKHPHAFHQYLMQRSRIFAAAILLHPHEFVRSAAQSFFRQLYSPTEAIPPEMIQVKFNSIRELLPELVIKILGEKQVGVLRSFLLPAIDTCGVLVSQLFILAQTDDPEMEQYKNENDEALILQFQQEIDSRMRLWGQEEASPLSATEGFENSDYASESDDTHELLDV